MQKLKTKVERVRLVTKRQSLVIRCGANLLPLKGLLYAMSHAKASRHVSGSQGKNASIAVRRLVKYMKDVSFIASELQKLRDPGGDQLYRYIKAATASYVDLFYELSEKERNSFLESWGGHHGKKIEREQNLLLIPAIMASRGEPKAQVAAYLTNSIYKIPFRVLFHSSKAAMHIELLEQAMGVKSAPDEAMHRFSAVLVKIDQAMVDIEAGKIKPEHDEELKEDFINEAVRLSEATDMRIADFMTEKVMPNALTERIAKRMIRRL